jgi:hypothetical protein
MEPTVLAGAIEFSPAEIALIIAVLAVAFVVVTAPGWLVLSIVMGRRPAPGATPGLRWAARAGGAVMGLAISVGVGSLVNGVLGGSFGSVSPILAVLAAWGACWALAGLLRRQPAAATPTAPGRPTANDQGWGR